MIRRAIKKLLCFYLLCAGFLVSCGVSSALEAGAPVVRPKVEYSASRLRDPFVSPKARRKPNQSDQPAQQVPLPKLEVQGVIWGGSFPQAIINSKVVKVGDVIENAQVTQITKDGVTVLFNGTPYNLSSPGLAGKL